MVALDSVLVDAPSRVTTFSGCGSRVNPPFHPSVALNFTFFFFPGGDFFR